MHDPPSRTVTFLFTDIEGSTKRWELNPGQMKHALEMHDRLLRAAIEAQSGYIFKTVGDGFCAAFHSPEDALRAVLSVQRSLKEAQWPDGIDPIAVRAALYTGDPETRDGDYFGSPLNRAARLLAAAHGGQSLVALSTYEALAGHLPPGAVLRDMGERRLKDLSRPERVFQVWAPGLPEEFPPLNTLDARKNNLPVQPTPLVGREKELREVAALLRGHEGGGKQGVRLVTLTGPGGIGKTRLGLQVAADMIDEFDDGVTFVDLSSVRDDEMVIPAIAQATGVRETSEQGMLQSLEAYLKEKKMLLMLDNFEQVAGAAPDVAHLLSAAPGIKMIVTSREMLHISGEQNYVVPALRLPGAGDTITPEGLGEYEAITLFVTRARAVQPTFSLTAANSPDVANICRRMDGLPLAIELAAARVRVLTPHEMLSRLGGALQLLNRGQRDQPPRHQTLRAAIDWSYELLTPSEQTLLRRLSVFASGFSLEATQAVCAPDDDSPLRQSEESVLDLLDGLVEKSLATGEENDLEMRFRLLDTIRQYAWEKLQGSGELDPLRTRHMQWYEQLAESLRPELQGPNQQMALDRLALERANLQAALEWSGEHPAGAGPALRLASSLWRYWIIKGDLSEGRRWLEAALALNGDLPDDEMAQLLYKTGTMAGEQGDYERAESALSTAAALFRGVGDRLGVSRCLNYRGIMLGNQGSYDEAIGLLRESLAIQEEVGSETGAAIALSNMAYLALERGEYAQASALAERCLGLMRHIDDSAHIAVVLNNSGHIARAQGDYAKARAYYEESLSIKRKLGDRTGIASSLVGLGEVASCGGDYETARALCEEALALYRELGSKEGIASALAALGDVERYTGNCDTAAEHYEGSLAAGREYGSKSHVAAVLQKIGWLALAQGKHTQAEAYLAESLQAARKPGTQVVILECLIGMATLAHSHGHTEHAARLLGAAASILESSSYAPHPVDRETFEQISKDVRLALGDASWVSLSAEGRALGSEGAIELALEAHGAP